MKQPLNVATVLICLMLCFISQFTSAQKFKVKWGENTKLKYDFDDAVPLANGNTMILKLSLKPKASFGARQYTTIPTLVLVDKSMAVISERELEIEEKDSEIQGFEQYGENIFFIYSSYDNKNKTTSINAIKVNEKTLEPISKTILGTFESDKKSDQATPTYKLSTDSTKVLLLVEGPERKKETEKFYIGVFDTNLKKLWSRQVELPIEQRFVDIHDVDVSNDSKVFLAIKHYESEVSRESVREDGSKVPSYAYKMLVYSEGNAKEKELRFDLKNHFIQGTKLIYNKNGTITVAGLYKKKHNGNITGAFYANFDSEKIEVKNPQMVDFPMDLLELVDKDKFATTKDKDPGLYPNFRIRHIMARSNGSVDLISEYYKLVIRTHHSQKGQVTTTYTYTYGDIVNTNISQDGKAVFTRIPKFQRMVNSNLFMGYFPLVQKDKLVILYNDDEDNVTRDLELKPDNVMRFATSVFAAATIDDKGNLSRQAIYSHRDEPYITVPTATTRISDTQYLIVSDLLKMFKKRTRFGVVDITN